MSRKDEAVQSYELALRIISDWGERLSSAECADIAYRGEQGDLGWLQEWQEPYAEEYTHDGS